MAKVGAQLFNLNSPSPQAFGLRNPADHPIQTELIQVFSINSGLSTPTTSSKKNNNL
ncbi:hypothetical protein PGT21_009788 [Puccinia graminis f. sp. tritici]|uniref:Uncharacterized protein n=1 Tax=Puccinia graminis f. sp. tritici TaxID=56615 RepID=A0A5B0RG76_PUCGR|nr:hypothetical protein PGT21_009788 [Puccinia graminis f. sp. tritici]KAA1124891.1 hypothetical protein PGTUg99_036435 [Puccinia graminis f. sp. tritici]